MMKRIIIVNNIPVTASPKEVRIAQSMVEQYKTDMQIAAALRRKRQYAHAVKRLVLERQQAAGG